MWVDPDHGHGERFGGSDDHEFDRANKAVRDRFESQCAYPLVGRLRTEIMIR